MQGKAWSLAAVVIAVAALTTAWALVRPAAVPAGSPSQPAPVRTLERAPAAPPRGAVRIIERDLDSHESEGLSARELSATIGASAEAPAHPKKQKKHKRRHRKPRHKPSKELGQPAQDVAPQPGSPGEGGGEKTSGEGGKNEEGNGNADRQATRPPTPVSGRIPSARR